MKSRNLNIFGVWGKYKISDETVAQLFVAFFFLENVACLFVYAQLVIYDLWKDKEVKQVFSAVDIQDIKSKGC